MPTATRDNPIAVAAPLTLALGTLTFTAQTARAVLAGPVSGGSVVPGFRQLSLADIAAGTGAAGHWVLTAAGGVDDTATLTIGEVAPPGDVLQAGVLAPGGVFLIAGGPYLTEPLRLFDSVNQLPITVSAGDGELVSDAPMNAPSFVTTAGGSLLVNSPDGASVYSVTVANGGVTTISATSVAFSGSVSVASAVLLPEGTVSATGRSLITRQTADAARRVLRAGYLANPNRNGRSGLAIYPITYLLRATGVPTANRLVATPHWFERGTVVTVGQMQRANGAAGTVHRFGLYADDGNGRPGALLADGGSVAADSGGFVVKAATVNYVIPTDGLYWPAGVTNSGASTNLFQAGDTGGNPLAAMLFGLHNGPDHPWVAFGMSHTATNALPANFSASPTILYGYDNVPVIYTPSYTRSAD